MFLFLDKLLRVPVVPFIGKTQSTTMAAETKGRDNDNLDAESDEVVVDRSLGMLTSNSVLWQRQRLT
jgi:hypothetical protein